jgi:hypothetical protein
MMPGVRRTRWDAQNHLRFLWCDGINPLLCLLDVPTPRVTVCPMSIRHRRLVLLVVSAAVAIVGFAVTITWWTTPDHGISWHSYRRIELGMTEHEVCEILALPPGSHLNLPKGEHVVGDHKAAASKGSINSPKGYSWVGNAGHLGVSFDDADKVVGESYMPHRREHPSLLDTIRAWFGF